MDEQEMIETAFDDLIKSLRKGTTEESVKMIRRAFEFAREAHQGVRRKSGNLIYCILWLWRRLR
ncbi:MAG: hypothetical protein V8R91_18280 [Butyricimonas faecihominis]